MKTSWLSPRLLFVSSLIGTAVIFRLMPHWPNFTPIAAIALFSGAAMPRKAFAFLIPIIAMIISDAVIGFHQYMWAVYASLIITVTIGFMLQKNIKIPFIGIAAISSTLLFFIVTNLAVWAGSPFYAQDITGLITCYTAGLPFLLNSLLGDLFYTSILFGIFYFAQQKMPVLVKC